MKGTNHGSRNWSPQEISTPNPCPHQQQRLISTYVKNSSKATRLGEQADQNSNSSGIPPPKQTITAPKFPTIDESLDTTIDNMLDTVTDTELGLASTQAAATEIPPWPLPPPWTPLQLDTQPEEQHTQQSPNLDQDSEGDTVMTRTPSPKARNYRNQLVSLPTTTADTSPDTAPQINPSTIGDIIMNDDFPGGFKGFIAIKKPGTTTVYRDALRRKIALEKKLPNPKAPPNRIYYIRYDIKVTYKVKLSSNVDAALIEQINGLLDHLAKEDPKLVVLPWSSKSQAEALYQMENLPTTRIGMQGYVQ